jgi:inositol transport system substrate-binding protein
MEYLAKQMAGKGNVVILLGDPRELATHTRTNGIKNVIAKYPGIKVVSEQRGDWMRDKALAVTENWIQSGIKFDAVVALNDEMAIGALMAGEQSGVKFLVGGIDALPPALKLLKEGKISVTVFQDGYTQGYQGVKAAYELVTGKKVPSVIDVPFKLVPPEKADEFMALYK